MKSEKNSIVSIITKFRIPILLLLLIPWALLFYWLESYIYPFFILAFLFICWGLFRNKKFNYSLLIISILILVCIDTRSLNAFEKIKSTCQVFAKNPMSSLNDLLTPNTGQQVVNESLVWMNSKLLERKLEDYKFSVNLADDEKNMLNMIELAWPAKYESDSLNVFMENDEVSSFPSCTLVDHNMEYSLVSCH